MTLFDESFKDKLGKRFLWPTRGKGPEGRRYKIEWYSGEDAYVGPLDLKWISKIRVADFDQVVS